MWSFFYQVALSLAILAAAPILLLRRRGHYDATVRARLGLGKLPGSGARPHLWIHAVSVGEVGVAATLAPRLPTSLPLVVTTVTPTGQRTARRRFAGASVTYLPFDLGPPVRRFLDHFQPQLLLLTEGDLWPILLRHARRRSLPVVVVNGRISDRSFRRMRRIKPLLGPMLAPVDHFGVQTDTDRDRLIELGVSRDKVSVTGNLKFDSPRPTLDGRLAAEIESLAAGRPILVAGSTMAGEEEKVLAAFEVAGAGSRGLLLLAPRHPERWETVADLLDGSHLDWIRRSQIGSSRQQRPAVVLVDSLGELAGLYRLAAGAFVGGTLSPTGGHNPLEPACFAVPVVVGPSMENFREIEEAFDGASAWTRVVTAEDLGRCWTDWLDRPAEAAAIGSRGRELIERSSGALDRTLELIEPWLISAESRA